MAKNLQYLQDGPLLGMNGITPTSGVITVVITGSAQFVVVDGFRRVF